MYLRELLKYSEVTVQCHDNPDADAIASGWGVYIFFKSHNIPVRFVYGGKFAVQKSNLVLMKETFNIPIEYVKELDPPELLVTVDCQYGQGNVQKFEAKNVAVIDHHRVTGMLPELNEVRSNIGSCATIVRDMLTHEVIDVNDNTSDELVEVLKGLGYKEKDIKQVLPKVDSSLEIEKQVKEALKLLNK